MYGRRHPRLPEEVQQGDEVDEIKIPDDDANLVEAWANKITQARAVAASEAANNIKTAQERQKRNYDNKLTATKVNFKKANLIFVNLRIKLAILYYNCANI